MTPKHLIPLVILAACGQVESTPAAEDLSRSTYMSPPTAPIAVEAPSEVPLAKVELDEPIAPRAAPARSGGPSELEIDQMPEIHVRTGESLALISDWSDVSIEDLALINEIGITDDLLPGQCLHIPLEKEEVAALEGERIAFSNRRLERYIAKRGGLVGMATHQVRTGETAWGISRTQAGMPTWVLSAYNADRDLDRLGVGDTLYIPVLGDTMATADAESTDPVEEIEEVEQALSASTLR